ncbi:MAG: adenosylcobinamide-phosphate synthase CbiB [Pseudomonadota bacterium]
MAFSAMMLVALGIDALLGWPNALFRTMGHPVTWLGRLISALEARLNNEIASGSQRRRAGVATVAIVLAAVLVPSTLVHLSLPEGGLGLIIGGVLAWPLIAAQSLFTHVRAVARPLAAGDHGAARAAVAMIVGRDPSGLDTAGLSRAALESLSENASDGVIAPLFWGLLLGLPGLAAYKAINTLDSMIGHKSERYADFGRAAAQLDDLANLVPARLTGVLIACGSRHPGRSLHVMRRDARAHRSPNAGWPEAAMAGALGVRLSGPRIYADRISDEPWLNGSAPDPGPDTLAAGLRIYVRAMALFALLLGGLAWFPL